MNSKYKISIKTFIHNIPFWFLSVVTGSMLLYIIDNKNRILPLAVVLLIAMLFFDFSDLAAIKKHCSVYMVIFAILISMWISQYLYAAIISSNICNQIVTYISLEINSFSIICSSIGCIISACFFISLLCFAIDKLDLNEEMRKLKREVFSYTHLIRTAVILLVLYLVAICTIILANVEYIDDIERKTSGIAAWGG